MYPYGYRSGRSGCWILRAALAQQLTVAEQWGRRWIVPLILPVLLWRLTRAQDLMGATLSIITILTDSPEGRVIRTGE